MSRLCTSQIITRTFKAPLPRVCKCFPPPSAVSVNPYLSTPNYRCFHLASPHGYTETRRRPSQGYLGHPRKARLGEAYRTTLVAKVRLPLHRYQKCRSPATANPAVIYYGLMNEIVNAKVLTIATFDETVSMWALIRVSQLPVVIYSMYLRGDTLWQGIASPGTPEAYLSGKNAR